MLEDVRVLDLSTGIPGAYCTKLFADAGADVVKVEAPEGDPLRLTSPPLFAFLNASKRGVTGTATDPGVLRLARRADLVVESVGDGRAERTDVAGLRRENPATVVVSISPFGLDGPWASRAATEFTLQGWCGSTGNRGTPDRPPLSAGGRIGEWVSGAYAAVGGLAAWYGARRSGAGEHVDVSMLDCMCVTMNTYAPVFASFLGWKRAPGPARTIEIPSIEPTKDGYVGFCTITAQQFRDFLVLIERPDLLDDKEIANVNGRNRRREEVLSIIRGWTSKRTTAEVIEAASLLRIPVAPIGNGKSVLEIEHFRERGVFVEHPGGGFLQPRIPYSISGVTPPSPRPAPAVGEHDGRVDWEPCVIQDGDGGSDRLPLEGIRIIDFTAFWAGPAATQMLASLGADVVKVESVQRPDGMRFTTTAPPSVDQWWEWCPVFHGANTNKRSVTLDMTRPEGVAIAKSLVAGADAITENFTPRVIEGFGLDWPAVSSANPRAVMVRMPAFGLTGPWRDRTGFAQTMEQVSGMAWVTGWEDGPPLIPRGPCDPMAGMHAAFALLLAVNEARRTGEGRLVEVTMVEAALNAAAEQVVTYTSTGRLLGRQGNRGPDAAPQGLYGCRGEDVWVAIAVANDRQWATLAELVGAQEWLQREDLAHPGGRRAAHDEIDGVVASWCRERDAEEVVEALASRGVAAARVVDAVDIGANPQIRSRRLLEEIPHPVTGIHAVPGVPFRFSSRKAGWLRSPAPTLGQHNDEVLGGELGMNPKELARLEEQQVIGRRPVGV